MKSFFFAMCACVAFLLAAYVADNYPMSWVRFTFSAELLTAGVLSITAAIMDHMP